MHKTWAIKFLGFTIHYQYFTNNPHDAFVKIERIQEIFMTFSLWQEISENEFLFDRWIMAV